MRSSSRWVVIVGLGVLPAIGGISTVVGAGEPSTAPILRLETGMHTAMISRIGVDAANRYLVTGSDDKTVRLWDLASGAWLKTFRPPLGEGNEGKIYAVAMSPDGQTVAAGGWTGYDWDKSHSIYLFDRASGRMIHRITGLPNVILHLAREQDRDEQGNDRDYDE